MNDLQENKAKRILWTPDRKPCWDISNGCLDLLNVVLELNSSHTIYCGINKNKETCYIANTTDKPIVLEQINEDHPFFFIYTIFLRTSLKDISFTRSIHYKTSNGWSYIYSNNMIMKFSLKLLPQSRVMLRTKSLIYPEKPGIHALFIIFEKYLKI